MPPATQADFLEVASAAREVAAKGGRRRNVAGPGSPSPDPSRVELVRGSSITFEHPRSINCSIFFCKGDKRLFVLVRTFVGSDKLKDTQRRLKETLDRYVRRHSVVIECLRYRSRLAFDADAAYGPVHCDLFVVPQPSTTDYQRALAELDAITSSDDWLSEIRLSNENKSRRHNHNTGPI